MKTLTGITTWRCVRAGTASLNQLPQNFGSKTLLAARHRRFSFRRGEKKKISLAAKTDVFFAAAAAFKAVKGTEIALGIRSRTKSIIVSTHALW